jgi:hypothetical protein
MTTLRIYDWRDHVLAVNLGDLIDLLAPRSLEANWAVSSVSFECPQFNRSDEFMIVGSSPPGEDKLELLAGSGAVVGGDAFSQAAHETRQVIWGQFVATLPNESSKWVVIRAIDSTFYEVISSDEVVINAIRSAYTDVRVVPDTEGVAK